MSMPDSMIVVETRTSASPARKACMRSSSSRSAIWPWGDEEAKARAELLQLLGSLVDGLDAVVEVERLALARVLALERDPHQLVVVLPDRRADRPPALGRCLDDRDVAEPGERHVERPGDRRCREREHVHLEPQGAQELLLGDAEALLLVDDDETELLRDHVPREDAVRPDEHLDLPLRELLQDGLHLRGPPEPRHHLDAHREVAVALAEGVPVLLGEDRRRAEHEHLPPVDGDAEGRAHRDLGLAEADIAADERSIGRGDSRSSFTASMARCWSSVSRYGKEASRRSIQSPDRSLATPVGPAGAGRRAGAARPPARALRSGRAP
jgi:hypothetical protein